MDEQQRDALLAIGKLTPSQMAVFSFVVRGLRNKDIALELQVSPRTVETHRARLMRKLKVRSVVDLVKLAIRAGVSCD